MEADCKSCGREYIHGYNGADKMPWFADESGALCFMCYDIENHNKAVDAVRQKTVTKMVYLDNLTNDLERQYDALRGMVAEKKGYIDWYLETIKSNSKEVQNQCDQAKETIREELDFIMKKMRSISKTLGRKPREKKAKIGD